MSLPSYTKRRESWKRYWLGIYKVPRAWAHKGENLVHAFEAVASASVEGSSHLDMNDQALMLAGMAIEVQLKAILVNMPEARAVVTASRGDLDETEKSLHKTFYRHNLVDLAQAAKVPLTHEREKTAAALSQYISWRGRYVLPTESNIDDLVPVPLDDGLVGQPHHSATLPAARDLVNHVIAEVKARLYGQS